MAFSGKNFVFNSIPSENYGLVITSESDTSQEPIADITPTISRIYKRNKSFLYGVTPSQTLEFSISLTSITGYIDSTLLGLISEWLFGQQNFQKLQIIQDDMTDIYFNCFLLSPQVIRSGNMIIGVKARVSCDSPFAYTFPRTTTHNFSTPPNEQRIFFDNLSHDSYYLYPNISFQMTSSGGDISISNLEEGREFLFDGLASNERISVNNDLQIIESSLGLLRLSKFNKNFLRFIPGRNTLRITGDISSLTLEYSFTRKIGG